MRNRSYIAGLILVLICFLAGFLSVLIMQDRESTQGQDLAPDGATRFLQENALRGEDHKMFLILGVDQLDSEEPLLLAVWLAIVKPTEKDILLLGFPIDFRSGGEGVPPFRSTLSISEQGDVSSNFLAAFERVNPYGSPDVVGIMDETCFSAVVDYLGGVPSGDLFLGGEEVIALLQMLYSEPDTLLGTQAQLLDRLRFQLPRLGDSFELTPLLDLIPDHCSITVDPYELVLWASPLLPVEPDYIRIELLNSSAETEDFTPDR
jgi:hypothetical protein